MVITGKVLVYDDNIDTDIICPGRFLELNESKDIANVAMSGIDSNFPEKAKTHSIIIAGKNFGCGSSRDHAVRALKYSGLKAVIAQSFGRIFYRNALNLGLLVIISKDARNIFNDGESGKIDLTKGKITNMDKIITVDSDVISEEEFKVYEQGGMIQIYKQN